MVGRFNRIMVNGVWTTGQDGFLTVYLNGRPVWSHQGRTINVNVAPYFRYGIYRSFVSRCAGGCGTQVAYYSNVLQGRSRADVE